MIFSVPGHIEKIISGEKTQTRRLSNKYEVGKTYAIQPKRGIKAISEGRIKILDAWAERWEETIFPVDSIAEGGYTPEEYERLFRKMYPCYEFRFAYHFRFEPSRSMVKDDIE